jgi:hypothetical protein
MSKSECRQAMNESNVSQIELSNEKLEQVLGGLTSSQVGQRGDAVPTVMCGPNRIGTPQVYLFWTGGGWHGG